MKDEKNKQQPGQQPQQSDMGQKKGSGQQGGMQSSDHHPQHSTGQSSTRKDQRRDVEEGDRRMGSNVENPDQQEQPGKKVNIDDDPDQTKKKVPNVHK